NDYAALAANLAFSGGSATAAGPGERRGNARRRAGGAGGCDDAFAACLGNCRAQTLGRDCYAQRAAGAAFRTAQVDGLARRARGDDAGARDDAGIPRAEIFG